MRALTVRFHRKGDRTAQRHSFGGHRVRDARKAPSGQRHGYGRGAFRTARGAALSDAELQKTVVGLNGAGRVSPRPQRGLHGSGRRSSKRKGAARKTEFSAPQKVYAKKPPRAMPAEALSMLFYGCACLFRLSTCRRPCRRLRVPQVRGRGCPSRCSPS